MAKITLPKGASIEDFDVSTGEGKAPLEGYRIYFSKSDFENSVYIQRKPLSKSTSEAKWRAGRINYYNKLFRTEKGYKKNFLRGSNGQVIVDYQHKGDSMQSRDYAKYIRANSTSEVEAYCYTTKPRNWNKGRVPQLRAVVDSLKRGR